MANKPKPKKLKLILAIIVAAVLIVTVLSVTVHVLTAPAPTGPGPVKIEVVTDRASYLQGEMINFSIYINNIQNWNVPHPTTVTYQIENYSTETVCIDYVNPPPTFPAHSRTFFISYVWNQETGNETYRTLVKPGNYTFTVSLSGPVDYGASANYTFEIKPNS